MAAPGRTKRVVLRLRLRLVTSQGSPYPSRSPRAHPSGWTRTLIASVLHAASTDLLECLASFGGLNERGTNRAAKAMRTMPNSTRARQ